MRQHRGAAMAEQYGVTSVPSVVVDGRVFCLAGGGVDAELLRIILIGGDE